MGKHDRIQIIGDIHNRISEAEMCIQYEQADKVILLGDYFDQFDDTLEDAKRVAMWLRRSLKQENRIHLLGNHDIWYFYSHLVPKCPGNTDEKRREILKIFPDDIWRQMKLLHIEGNVLFSHAGLRPQLFAHPVRGMSKDHLLERCERALQEPHNPILEAGRSRGGPAFQAGIIWQDWREMAFAGDWNQIVGHTPDITVRIARSPSENNPARFNACFDTHNKHYGVIEDEKLYSVSSSMGSGDRKFLVDFSNKPYNI